jgi:hypothetical protein
MKTSQIYTEYELWCRGKGLDAADQRFFLRDLLSLLPKLQRQRRGSGNQREYGYTGIRFQASE